MSSELECRLTTEQEEVEEAGGVAEIAGGGVAEVAEEGVVSVTVRSVSSPGDAEQRETSGGLNSDIS